MGADTSGTSDKHSELKKQLDRLGGNLRRLRNILAMFGKATGGRVPPDAVHEKKVDVDLVRQLKRDKNLAALNHYLSLLRSDNEQSIN